MKRNVVVKGGISVLILFLAFGLFAMLTEKKQHPVKAANNQPHLKVKTELVKNDDFKETMTYSGRVSSFETISLSAEVTGKILHTSVPLKEGEYFSQGDMLINIYQEDNKASLKSLKSNFLKTLATLLPNMSVDFEESYNKWNTFFGSIDLDKNLPELPKISSEKERIYLAASGVLSDYYSIKQQEIKASKYTISAPFSGFYKKVNKTEGSIATAGSEIAQIIRADKLEVTVPVVSSDSRKLTIGQQVIIRKDNFEQKGKISRIAGFVNASTQSVNVYVGLTSTKGKKIFEGEYVIVDFSFPIEGKGVRINREALLNDNYVYTVRDNKLQKKQVQPLYYSDDYVIVGGLKNGETLVVESLVNVREGLPVKTFKAEKPM